MDRSRVRGGRPFAAAIGHANLADIQSHCLPPRAVSADPTGDGSPCHQLSVEAKL
jgi:hypothetical protein